MVVSIGVRLHALKAKRGDSGVTLVELLVALVIISIVIYGIINFFSLNLVQNSKELKRSRLYYRAVAEMESLLAKDYAASDLDSLYSPLNSVRFFEDANFLLKVQIESLDPMTGLQMTPYPTNLKEDPLLKKITVSVANLDEYNEKKNNFQVDLVRYISP